MKKLLLATLLLIVFLAVLIPFASSNPDGLEKALSSLGIEESESFWKGLMTDYSVAAIGDSYFSTLAAGVIGTMLVLTTSLVLGRAIAKRGPSVREEVMASKEQSQQPKR